MKMTRRIPQEKQKFAEGLTEGRESERALCCGGLEGHVLDMNNGPNKVGRQS